MKRRNTALVLFAAVFVAALALTISSVNAYSDCNPSWLNEYTCYGNDVHRLYLNYDCTTDWEFWEHCDYDCVNGECTDYSQCTEGWLNDYTCYGDYRQRLWQYSDCSNVWKNIEYCEYGCYLGHCIQKLQCTEGWLNQYRCSSGDYRQRLYRYSDCDTEWRNWEHCTYGCSSGVCDERDYCDVDAYSLTFRDRIHEGESTTIIAKAKNTGDYWERITMYIYVDNVLEHTYAGDIRSGDMLTRTLTIRPDTGTHYVKIKVFADCGAQDVMTKTLTVYRPSYPSPAQCDYDNRCESWESSNCADCDYEPYEPAPDYTSVTFYPSTLDLKLYEGKVVTINVETRYQQAFTVNVGGVPSDWLSYTKTATIRDDDKIYVYITPKGPGLYDLDITVRAQDEGRTFRKTISMYVSEDSYKSAKETGMPITGMITLTDEQVIVGVGILVIIIIIVLGVILLRRPGYY